MTLRQSARLTPLQATSLLTGLMAVIVGVAYFGPEQLVRRSLPAGQTSLVKAVESLGPVWPVIFTAMGLALILACTLRRHIVAAHAVSVLGWMFYGSCLLIGSLQSEPPGPILTGILSVFVALIHLGLMFVHQDEGDR